MTVVVPATDRPASLRRCLAAIANAAAGPDELVVVEEPAYCGFAAARRAGAARATGDVIVFVDSDVLVHDDVFVRVREAFAADPGLAALFGSYDATPEAATIVSDFRNLLHHHVHQTSAGPASTFWGGLGAVRRDALDDVGGLDPNQRWLDDIELGMRLAANGRRIELRPDIQGTHLKRWTLQSMLWTDFARRGMPWVELMLERRTVPSGLNLGWRQRISTAACLVGVGAAVARRPALGLGAVAMLLLLNRSFYALLADRRGLAEAAAGVGLHAAHYLAGAAAIPAGGFLYLVRRAAAGTSAASTRPTHIAQQRLPD